MNTFQRTIFLKKNVTFFDKSLNIRVKSGMNKKNLEQNI